ncbi:hypothetical protein AgCh_018052 [Apium graveolens]
MFELIIRRVHDHPLGCLVDHPSGGFVDHPWGGFVDHPSVTKRIEKLIRYFIWGGGVYSKGKAKVAWKDVCTPKQEGGLGLKSLRCWNRALMAFHIWNIVSDNCSLWVKWIHPYRIKGQNFWDIQVCSHRNIKEMGLNKSNIVVDFISNEGWVWPQGLLLKIPQLRDIHPCFSDNPDRVVLISRVGKAEQFSVHHVWGLSLIKSVRVKQELEKWGFDLELHSIQNKLGYVVGLGNRERLGKGSGFRLTSKARGKSPQAVVGSRGVCLGVFLGWAN